MAREQESTSQAVERLFLSLLETYWGISVDSRQRVIAQAVDDATDLGKGSSPKSRTGAFLALVEARKTDLAAGRIAIEGMRQAWLQQQAPDKSDNGGIGQDDLVEGVTRLLGPATEDPLEAVAGKDRQSGRSSLDVPVEIYEETG